MKTCGQWAAGGPCGRPAVRRYLTGWRCAEHEPEVPTPAAELTLEGHAGVVADARPARHYAPDQLGGACEVCGNPIPAALAGVLEHPTCAEPDLPRWQAAAQRAERIRAKTSQTGHA